MKSNIFFSRILKYGFFTGLAYWITENSLLLPGNIGMLAFPLHVFFNLLVYIVISSSIAAISVFLSLAVNGFEIGEKKVADSSWKVSSISLAFAYLTMTDALILTGNLSSAGGTLRGLIPLYSILYLIVRWTTRVPGKSLQSYVPEAIGAAFLVTSIHFSGIVPGRHVSLLTFQVTSIIFVLIFSTLFSVIPRKSTLFRIYRLSVISTTLAILVFYVLFPVFTYTLHLRKQHSDKLSLNEVSKTETNNPGEKHYNFILIVIDTLRSDELGNPHNTPSIHKLAGSSLVFKNAHSLSPWTVPSVTSILTSAPPVPVSLLRHGIDPDFFRTIYSSGKWKEAWFKSMNPLKPIPETVPTIATILKDSGYMTSAFVNNPLLNQGSGFARGFDKYRLPIQWDRSNASDLFSMTLASRIGIFRKTGSDSIQDGQHNRDCQLIDEAMEWIDQVKDRGPFFTWIHLMAPHIPYTPMSPPKPDSGYNGLILNAFTSETLEMVRSGQFSPQKSERDRIRQLYTREIAETDPLIGKLMDYLDSSGLHDNTLVILTSDHGEEFWEHGGLEHGHSMYDELLHVPLIIRCPWKANIGTTDEKAFLVDILPTVIDLLGINNIGIKDGTHAYKKTVFSGIPLMKPGSFPESRLMYAAGTLYGPQLTALFINSLKIIHNPLTDSYVLFNLETDPAERIPLKPANELVNLLANWEKDAIRKLSVESQDGSMVESLRSLGYIN